MSNQENKLKHLEMIQGVISRMAGNAFFLKGWTVTLLSALFALYLKDPSINYFTLGLIPLLIFWWLDSFYLSQERKFRRLYDNVRKLKETEIDFSMNTDIDIFRNDDYFSLKNCAFSVTIRLFYLYPSLIILLFVFMPLFVK